MHHSCLKGTPSSSTVMTTVTTNTSLQRMHSVGTINNNAQLVVDNKLANAASQPAAAVAAANGQSGMPEPLTSEAVPILQRNGNHLSSATSSTHQKLPPPPVIRWTTTAAGSGLETRATDSFAATAAANTGDNVVRRSFS